jgi:hypothetical protein
VAMGQAMILKKKDNGTGNDIKKGNGTTNDIKEKDNGHCPFSFISLHVPLSLFFYIIACSIVPLYFFFYIIACPLVPLSFFFYIINGTMGQWDKQ